MENPSKQERRSLNVGIDGDELSVCNNSQFSTDQDTSKTIYGLLSVSQFIVRLVPFIIINLVAVTLESPLLIYIVL
jgi:hypothetical protein